MSFAHSWEEVGEGANRQAEQTHGETKRQARQADGAEKQPHLQEPASSTSVWGTDATEGEGRAAGEAQGRGQRERERQSHLKPPLPVQEWPRGAALPRPPSPPTVLVSVRPSIALASPRAVLGPPHRQGPQERLSGQLPALSSPAAAGWSGEQGEVTRAPVTGPSRPPGHTSLTPLTVSTQKRSLCSKLARAKGPGSVFVHSKAKATMRASMTARWAPCGGKG